MSAVRSNKHSVKKVKPRITIVGAGNLANSLARSLHQAGYKIDQIVASAKPGSLRRARSLAAKVGASANLPHRTRILSDVVWFCVPDNQISAAAKSLHQAADWQGKVAVHSSGALTSDELASLGRLGATVASAHPLMTFVVKYRPTLGGVSFTLEGDRKATQVARAIVLDLGGHSFPIRKHLKAAYHAWGMFVSPLITALLATGERVAAAAGIPPADARRRSLPVVLQTVANYSAFGPAAGFSGPLVRGDSEVVRRHLRALRTIPPACSVYAALLNAALEVLPGKNRKAIKEAVSQPRTFPGDES